MQMTDRQKKIWGIATVFGLVVFMGLLCWFVGRPMIRFVSEPEKFRLWVDEHGIWGRLAFIGMVIFQIIVAIIPGEPLEIGAGYAFGAVEGTILCLIGAVLVGVNFAKGLAYSAGKPLVPVHHLRGHIAALYLTHPELKPPFLCLVASGGHSHIVEVQDYTHYHILGHTVDDAAGEAFDKVARTLGLPYPGGPSVANAAKTGNPKAYRLPVPHVDGKYNVSFSGLKTAVLNEVNQAQMKGTEIHVPDLAASFQERIAGILAEKLLLAAADTGAKQVCLAGGVAANGRLRQLVNDGAQKLGAKVYLPELKFCGDNGAMIAAQGYYQYIAGHTAGLELNGLPTLPIDYE